MTPGPRKVVLDASAVLAWVLHERGWDTVDTMLPVAVLPAPNLAEVLEQARAYGHRMREQELYEALVAYGLRVEPVLPADGVRAAELIGAAKRAPSRAVGTLSLGDGLCLAVAERLGLPVTGGDQVWESVDLTVPYLPFR